jgi:hypothetical protein
VSYTPEQQYLEPGIEKICEGIDLFNAAALERIKDSGEWQPDHLEELGDFIAEFTRLRVRLTNLKNRTR